MASKWFTPLSLSPLPCTACTRVNAKNSMLSSWPVSRWRLAASHATRKPSPLPRPSLASRVDDHPCAQAHARSRPRQQNSGAQSRLWSGAAVAPRHPPPWPSLAGWRCANARRVPTPAGTSARYVATSAAHQHPLHTNTRWVQRRRSVVVYTTDSRPRRGLLLSCIHGCPRHSSCGDMRWGALRLAAPFTPLRPASRRVVPFHATSRGLSTSIR